MLRNSGIFSAMAAIVLLIAAAPSALAQIITVETTRDSIVYTCPPFRPCRPACTLRNAIIAANTNLPVSGCVAGLSSGADQIIFDVGAGTPRITLASELPPITESVEINGKTGGATRIEITPGNGAIPPGRRIDGLILLTGESTIRNLVVNGFNGNGIVMTSINSGYLPDHNPPSIPDRSIPPAPGPGEDPPPYPTDGESGSGNKIFGCFIGTDATGTMAVGNGSGFNAAGIADTAGILSETSGHIIGGPTLEERNVISGNRGYGIMLGGVGHLVRGNYIGVAVNDASLGNLSDGIIILGGQSYQAFGTIGASQSPWDGNCKIVIDSNGQVSNARSDCGNKIAYNGRYGVLTIYNKYEMLSNSIFSNGDLGIDVDSFGVTPNNPTGSNRNYPEWILPWFVDAFGNIWMNGSITNMNSGFRIIQLFHNYACDPSGYGEGQDLIRTFTVPVNGRFSYVISGLIGHNLTATSTSSDLFGHAATSEFSACR
jgi:hypothetical protein